MSILEEARQVREALTLLVPDIDLSSVTAAQGLADFEVRELRAQADRIERLMRRWRVLEAALAAFEEQAGRPPEVP